MRKVHVGTWLLIASTSTSTSVRAVKVRRLTWGVDIGVDIFLDVNGGPLRPREW